MQIIAEVDSKFKIQKEEKNTFKTYHTAHVSDHKGQGHPFQLVCLTSSCLKRQIVENRQKTDKEAWLIVKSDIQGTGAQRVTKESDNTRRNHKRSLLNTD